MRVGLVSDEFVVDEGCSNSLRPVTPAQHLQELLLEVVRVLFVVGISFERRRGNSLSSVRWARGGIGVERKGAGSGERSQCLF